MIRVHVLGWAAWSPGLADPQSWRAWARAPKPLEKLRQQDAPEVRFLPAMQRRRCDQLSRMMLQVAHDGCPEDLRTQVTSVFASRHGAFGTMASLLEDVARRAPLSPARFSHSVHNTQAGLFSIWARNPQASTCVAAGPATFCHGFLEASSMLCREPGRPVLYICGDEPIPELFAEAADYDPPAYAVALLLGEPEARGDLDLRIEPGEQEADEAREWPDALEFVRWLVGNGARLSIAHAAQRWTWERLGD